MDELSKILIEHHAEFEEEPKEGHFDRFKEKLRLPESKRKRLHISPFLKVAVVLVIVLLSANLYVHLRNHKTKVQESVAVKSDLGEASFYYTNSINNGIRDLEQMAKEGIGSHKEIVQIKHELAEMDSLFVNLQQEYRANPNDERIINAMIEYYQTKLDIVNTIKTDLENVKQLKRKNHENPEI
ncbi:MAG: hypothetical protein NTY07_07590 [Bacteroidia bacterium]|nr:hypothetical protein [Bacteroidia bacterium]